MAPVKSDIADRLRRHIDILRADNFFGDKWNKIKKAMPDISKYRTNHLYPLLKYALVAVYTGTYATAIKELREKGEVCYLDATAGSGITIIDYNGSEIPVFGTGIIGLIMPTYGLHKLGKVKERDKAKSLKFNKAIFFEIDNKKRNLLKKLHSEVCETLKYHGYDCPEIKYNTDINYFDPDEYNCVHWLIVIDPEGAEINWSTMKKFLSLKADIIYNYMCAALRRQIDIQCENIGRRFDEYFPSDWRTLCDKRSDDEKIGEELYNFYKSKIVELGKNVYDASVFGDVFDWHYHLMLILRRRGLKKHPWVERFEEYKTYIEILREEGLKKLLGSPPLTQFI
ncbi:MAG: hypothetical protein QXP98_02825 [Thermoproteus sp.]